MIILKTLGIFFLTFIIGNFFGLIFKFVLEPKPELPKFLNSNSSIEKLKLRGFNNEDVWIKPDNTNVQKVSETKIEPPFKPEIFDVPDFEEIVETKFNVKLIDVFEYGNSYRKEEVIAKSGETWLGLFEENGKFKLKQTKVKVRSESRENYGWDVTIKVNNKTEPKILLKNAKSLREGKVETLFNRHSYEEAERPNVELLSLNQGFVQKFQLGDREYTFRVKEGLTKSKRKILALVLETGNESQIIYHILYSEAGDYVGN
ncbi:MAG TPA: hypothetical protein PKE69_07460, partial [Pyrinomonadaceae bacterium]|nr:hypothetical protein [Pyrinomonadaceae bacterium]